MAETKSIVGAASILGMDSSSLSRCISKLERLTGVKLLYRSTHKVQLTSDGEEIYHAVKDALEIFDETLTNKVLGNGNKLEDTIKICSPVCFSEHLINRCCLEIRKNYPNIRFRLAITDKKEDPLSSGMDIVIQSTLYPHLKNKPEVFELGYLTSTMVAAPSYIEKYGSPEEPEDLSQHALLHYSGIGSDSFWLMKNGVLKKLDIKPVISAVTSSPLIYPTLMGEGILVNAFHFLVQKYIDTGKLVEVMPSYEKPSLYVSAVIAKSSMKKVAVHKFLNVFKDIWGKTKGLYQ